MQEPEKTHQSLYTTVLSYFLTPMEEKKRERRRYLNSTSTLKLKEHSIAVMDSAQFSCKYCGKSFSSYQGLGGHQNAHKMQRAEAKQVVLNQRPSLPLPSQGFLLLPVGLQDGMRNETAVLVDDEGHAARPVATQDFLSKIDELEVKNNFLDVDKAGLFDLDLTLKL